MASVTSLGIHKPSALPFLISEGILPPDPSEDLFRWQTVSADDSEEDDGEEEELVTTEHCVVWSRGSVTQRVFRFEAEQERVTQAIFTYFPSEAAISSMNPGNEAGLFNHSSPVSVAKTALSINKARTSTSKPRVNIPKHVPNNVESESYGFFSGNRRHNERCRYSRALVVILKRQAHIFFLSGTSHTVHFPFEVDAVFPLFQGLLLQRMVHEDGREPPTLRPPSVPPNSFAFTKSVIANEKISFQEQSIMADVAMETEPGPPFLPLLDDLQRQSNRTAPHELPRLFSLVDPLTAMGNVATESAFFGKKNLGHQRSTDSVPDVLNIQEKLLYVSSDEGFGRRQQTAAMKSTAVAVTQNQKNGSLTIWSVSYIDCNTDANSRRRYGSNVNGAAPGRRSSYGHSVGTGATTPVGRGAVSGRESIGVTGLRGQSSKDTAVEEDVANTEDDLVTQLGPAFENPGAPAKSSRRVSSLLARADLSTSHEKSTFPELTSSQVGFNANRRGASFGAYGTGVKSGLEGENAQTHSKSFDGSRFGLDFASLPVPSYEDDFIGLDSMADSISVDEFSLGDAVRSFRNEIIFTKIYSIPNEVLDSQYSLSRSAGLAGLKVFTFELPDHNLGVETEDNSVVLCLLDRGTHELSVLQITWQQQKPAQTAHDQSRTESDDNRRNIQGCRARVTRNTKHTNVLDACLISKQEYFRILICNESAEGLNVLSLQAPWSPTFKIQLPSTLFLNNPYNFTSSESSRQKHEGGFKRVLSEEPRAFVALEHADSNGRVDVIDGERRKHRIEIQLTPRNPYVHKMIRVIESVLPQSNGNKESILRVWWDVMSWLPDHLDEGHDMEWTALIVVLSCMALGFIEEKRDESTLRKKKRKRGLLRSSSGANTDLSSWETMLDQESQFSTSPPWMQHVAWSWTMEQENVLSILRSSRSKPSRVSRSISNSTASVLPVNKKSTRLLECLSLARDFLTTSLGLEASGPSGHLPTALSRDPECRRTALATILVGLHLLREEYKLNVLTTNALHDLTPVLAQIGGWLGWESWGFKETSYYALESVDMGSWSFDNSLIRSLNVPAEPFTPPSILGFIESSLLTTTTKPFISLVDVVSPFEDGKSTRIANETQVRRLMELTPNTVVITNLLVSHSKGSVQNRVAEMASWGISICTLETLPESVAVPFRAAITSCQADPVTKWDNKILGLIGRDDMGKLEQDIGTTKPPVKSVAIPSNDSMRDVHFICNSTLEIDTVGAYDESAEEDRQAITRMIFKDDQRFAEAAKLVHPLRAPIAQCFREPDWSDTELLIAQQELVKIIVMRTLSTSLGRGLMFYCARLPLLTEKFPIHGFALSCVMKPSNTTVTADRNAYTEEKVSWAFFHAGVEAGLSISRDAKGIDRSWIMFNKPPELKNRHAGFLLALGLNGHLKSLEKWVAFKYLTPKHTMTSIGLLLGLSASYLGTMDTNITRLLSVHITRMLPPGAAELNVSPLTQTSGMMGIGLLYCNTQHRRMSEVMLSEMENVDYGDNSSPFDSLRDEGYRLAAGFALGYINLGRGKDLKGLHDMRIVQRLLALAVGTKKVSIVHILDKATAAATIAIVLIFLKTEDAALARKIDIPDTAHQFDYVRPDIFLLRTVARHLIMWNDIRPTGAWMEEQLPSLYRSKMKFTVIRILTSEDMPFFNIVAGLCLSIGLRFAGTGSVEVRNLLCHYLDQFMRICRLPTLNYDGKLARISVRNCQDVVALAAACVMAGTGDLLIFRRLRSLHGRTDADTPYGSHLAAHLAIGVLFLGGGTHTFGTSNLAIASLLCAFYPLFPNTVLDNKSHLQAFRHFWVLAAEPRCLVARDADSYRPVSLPIRVTLRSGKEIAMTAPCLLPELETLAKIQTNDFEHWRVTLDLSDNPTHLRAFKRHQSIFVRRRAAYDAHASVFSATIQALNDSQSMRRLNEQALQWVFTLPTFAGYDGAERGLVLPEDDANTVCCALRGTVVDDRLVFEKGCVGSGKSERLWNLRILFSWADGLNRRGEKWGWYGKEMVESLRAALKMKIQAGSGEQAKAM
ncbi:Anaphase-promoting complex subunit 1 [Pseudocyphellaria aurata]|nr:Anaphase-promoting complex subunit 1 [Pseudocyphellaria aurata]